MLKDATPEDIASTQAIGNQSVSGGTGNGGSKNNSEIGRLQKLPGFYRLQKQIFYNLMSAKHEHLDQNIRVKPKLDRGQSSSDLGVTDKKSHYGARGVGEKEDSTRPAEESFDRKTIKKISKLIIERDAAAKKRLAETSSTRPKFDPKNLF